MLNISLSPFLKGMLFLLSVQLLFPAIVLAQGASPVGLWKKYVDGQILDLDSGSTYRSKFKVLDNGQKLNVRGYIGIPALGRTQVWIRED